MHIEVIVFIIFLFWIFVLQNRINRLEKAVYGSEAVKAEEKAEISKELEREGISEKKKEKPPAAPKRLHKDETVETAQDSLAAYFSQEHLKDSVSQQPSDSFGFMTWLTNYFTGGNLLVRIGGVVLFFGLAFLVKYVAEHSIISVKMRLWGIAFVAVALIVTGWRLREREGAYGQVLQGLGVAILYLVIYAASKFYGLLTLEAAFVLMFAVVIVASLLAVVEDALPLALFASAGGFLVPILTSSGDGSHVILFSYYAFLNLGIFIVAWFRSWRVLNLIGFLFTFVIATVWGVLRYRADMFGTTEPFLLLFFMMYLTISILFTMKHPYRPKHFVDSTLVFGLPLIAFPLQLHFVDRFAYGEAYSAMALGALYAGLYMVLKKKERMKLLAQSFLVLSVIFFTIAVPYIFEADVSAVLWSIEGTAVIWLSLKQNRALARYFGIFLLLVSALIYPADAVIDGIDMAEYLGFLIIIAGLMVAAWLLDGHRKVLHPFMQNFVYLFLLLSLGLWFIATPAQLEYFGNDAYLFSLVAAALISVVIIRFANWRLLEESLQIVLPLGIVLFYLSKGAGAPIYDIHPFMAYGFWSFIGLVGTVYLLLFLYDKVWRHTRALHVLTLWFMVSVLTFEAHYHIATDQTAKSILMVSWAIVPLLFAIGILVLSRYLGRYKSSYEYTGLAAIFIFLLLWEIVAFGVPADFMRSAYLPLANPIDMMQVAVLAAILFWTYKQRSTRSSSTIRLMYGIVILLGWMLVTVVFARYVHISQGIAYTLSALWQSGYFQTGISVLWSVAAIVAMLLSKRYADRTLWLAGFGVLILVVLKLFLVELAHSGTIERIISFLVVGVLLLLIGYFVPMPPSENKLKSEHDHHDEG